VRVAGAFQTDGHWLLLSDEDGVLDWATGPGTDDEFGRRLVGSGRLPDLAGAPVASWVAARLCRLLGRLPAWASEQHGDEGAYRFAFLVFGHDRTHLGVAEVVGDRAGVAACCECSDAAGVLAELATALLAEPAAVAECRVVVWEAEDEAESALQSVEADTRVQAVYGYEGGMYLGL
jgi:hypothetical protein